MKLSDLRGALRELLGDETKPYLWADKTLDRFLNNAVREACLRARLLKDDADTLPELCSIDYDAGQKLIRFAPEILVVRSGNITSRPYKLYALTADSMDRREPCWNSEDAQPGCPEYLVMDITQKTIRLYPVPDAAGTLKLRVWRMPRAAELMKGENDCPVIQIPDPEELKHWAAFEAFMIKDAETFDPSRAGDELAVFESRFGGRPDLHEMARWADSPPRARFTQTF